MSPPYIALWLVFNETSARVLTPPALTGGTCTGGASADSASADSTSADSTTQQIRMNFVETSPKRDAR
ncbi:MAG: hypothetical protein A6F72_04695 [Cycloclasticus sp. symbiont of Poecilosclerida sp. N]|nr:MAG: hypothetical protein A6F72_04695 [Cycloclasticus sp. symbiont of Poecilosclerida sp. N]